MNRLGQQLIQHGLITQEQLEEALEYQVTIGGRIGKVLQKLGFVDEEEFAKFLAKEYNHAFLSYDEIKVDSALLKRYSRDDMQRKNYFPINKKGSTVSLAMSNPMDIEVTDNLSAQFGGIQFEVYMVTDRTVERILRETLDEGQEEDDPTVNVDVDEPAVDLKSLFKQHSEKKILYALLHLLSTKGKIDLRDLVKKLS